MQYDKEGHPVLLDKPSPDAVVLVKHLFQDLDNRDLNDGEWCMTLRAVDSMPLKPSK